MLELEGFSTNPMKDFPQMFNFTHVSVNSTCYYLTFVEGIQKEASTLFKQAYGSAVITKDGIVDDKKN